MSATPLPCRKLIFSIDALSYTKTFGFRCPGRFVVPSADGDVITVTDVVEELSPNMIQPKSDEKKVGLAATTR